ncbi:MAG: hypothetical protein C5B51_23785 [Terriglobia bacterium]|nr:MAG: hypothetical protein C5B51_23785 [Terriglobia bacterium]
MTYQTERSFADIFQDVIGNVQKIIHSEIQLAKAEVKEETTKAGKAAGIVAGGAVLGLYALGFLLVTVTRALEIVTAPWVASLIVAVSVGAAAYVAIHLGRSRMKHVHAVPEKTIQTTKENAQWVKDQIK